MANDLNFEKDHDLTPEQLRERLETIETKLKDRYGVQLLWDEDEQSAEVKGPGVTGSLDLSHRKVSVNLKLGLLMRPMSEKIRQAMQEQLDKVLV